MVNLGKFKNHVIETKAVTMSTAVQAQSEVQIPAYGDIYAFEIVFDASATGTLSSATTLDYAIDSIVVKAKDGTQLLQNVRGIDLLFLERYRNKGVSRTIATTSGTAQAEQFFIPLNVELKDQEVRVQMSIAPYSAMASSGATGGTVNYSTIAWYYDATENIKTERIQRITKAMNVGVNTFGVDLPKNVTINNILFSVTTEARLNYIRFTADGKKEMDGLTPNMLIGIDKCTLVSGHVTGQFSLYNAPFYSTSATALDFNGQTTADVVQLIIISNKDN